jgi:hypothetical protein
MDPIKTFQELQTFGVNGKMFKKFLLVVGFIWALPVSLLFWFLLGVLYLLGQVDRVVVVKKDFIFVWFLKKNGWFYRKYFEDKGWSGFAQGNNVIISSFDSKLFKHERRHCYQHYVLGVFFILVYIVHALVIYYWDKEKHPYFDNILEIDARVHSGGLKIIPKSSWGPKGRWIW